MNFRATCRLAARRPAARRTEALKFRVERPSASRPLAPLSPAACSAAQHLRLVALQPDGLRLCAWGLSILWSVGLRHSWQSSARRPATQFSAALGPAAKRPADRRLAAQRFALHALRPSSSERTWPCVVRASVDFFSSSEPRHRRLAAQFLRLSALRPVGSRLSTGWLSVLWPGDLRFSTLRLCALRPDDLHLRTLRLSVVRLVAPYFSERRLPAQHPAAKRPAIRRPVSLPYLAERASAPCGAPRLVALPTRIKATRKG